MDIHELREKAGIEVTEDEYELIHYVYMNQSEIMHVYEMAEFIKAHKTDYVWALCEKFSALLYKAVNDRAKDNEVLRRRIEHLKGDLRRAQEDAVVSTSIVIDHEDELEQLKADFEALKAETARKDALLQAYAKFMPIEELAIRLAAEVM